MAPLSLPVSLLSMKPCWHDKFISGVSSGPCQPAINKLHLKCHLVLLLLFLVLPLFLTFPPCILTLSLFSLLYLVPSLFSPHFLSAIHASFPFLSFISPFFFFHSSPFHHRHRSPCRALVGHSSYITTSHTHTFVQWRCAQYLCVGAPRVCSPFLPLSRSHRHSWKAKSKEHRIQQRRVGEPTVILRYVSACVSVCVWEFYSNAVTYAWPRLATLLPHQPPDATCSLNWSHSMAHQPARRERTPHLLYC